MNHSSAYHPFSLVRPVLAIVLCLIASVVGCGGGGDDTGPKTGDLTEEQKKQIEELNNQRVDEWGKKVK